ncbi:MAG: alkaline phosphatase family protein [Acidobacteriota bacterium]|nr:alkaline phosphatase family protein [Acidobacteriota bacterium]
MHRRVRTAVLAGMLALSGGWLVGQAQAPRPARAEAAAPIEHLVVIFDENVSFDHYFGTYPDAANPPGEPPFHAAPGTPSVNGLSGALLTRNPNALNTANGTGAVNPFRLDRSQAATADQNHGYTAEQLAFHNGLMDLFPRSVGNSTMPVGPHGRITLDAPAGSPLLTKGVTLGYFDGNTVTALWNYAQHFAMSDNSYGTTFGPSTPGAINLVSGQTNGIVERLNGRGGTIDGGHGSTTLISDVDPLDDVCSSSAKVLVRMGGPNIGDALTKAGVTWGWFQGGFDLGVTNPDGSTGCFRTTLSAVTHVLSNDYVPHHEPFQYYRSTANPKHLRPSSVAAIGHNGDRANHQYDLHDFFAAVQAGNFPAVSFLKPPAYQNGHAGNSDPLDEQAFIVHVLNFLQQRPEWRHTAVIIAYDDSDGWYDHQLGPIVNQSTTPSDALSAVGACGDGSTALPGIDAGNPHAQGRCGYGPRLPLLVISPWARPNFVDHTVTDQSSVIRFIEDRWLHGRRLGHGSFDALAGSLGAMFDFRQQPLAPLVLDGKTGEPQR